jgi:hypothetical protein
MNDIPEPSIPPQPPFLQPESAPPPVEPVLDGPLDAKKLFDALLRAPKALVERLAEPGHGAAGLFLAILLFSMLAYGLVLGSFAMGGQLWAAPVKIVSGILISGVICFPSLYIFFCLSGSRIGVGQLATVLLGMLSLGGLLLLGFAPAVWIFTQATNAFGFMGVLALVPWLVALFFGCRFLFHAAKATGAGGLGPVKLWAAMFLIVTLQMSTSLRPILGRSDKFLTNEKLFFLQHWAMSIDKDLPPVTQAAESAHDSQ